jgi:hypothetical protein
VPFPNFSYCLVCEGVRQEIGGKLTIFGFYGLAPNVDIAIVNPNLPVTLTLIAGFPIVQDIRPYTGTLLVTKPNGTIAFQAPPAPVQVAPGRGGLFGAGVVLTPPHVVGRYSVQVLINNEEKLRTDFNVRFPQPGELAAMGIPTPPGRTN